MALATRINVSSSIEAVLCGKASLDGGGSAAFDEIYNHYRPRLVSFAARRGALDPEGAADLALFDTFRAAPNLNNKTEEGFRAYLYTALRSHTAADLRHKSRSADPVGSAGEVEALTVPDAESAFSPVDGMWLGELLQELPTDQRSVVELRFGEDLSGSETARRLERSPDAVYQLQHRALRNLRVLIAAAGCLILMALTAVALRAGSTRVVSVDPVTTAESGPVDGTQGEGAVDGATVFGNVDSGPTTTALVPNEAAEGRLRLSPPLAEPTETDRSDPEPAAAAPGPDGVVGESVATTVPGTEPTPGAADVTPRQTSPVAPATPATPATGERSTPTTRPEPQTGAGSTDTVPPVATTTPPGPPTTNGPPTETGRPSPAVGEDLRGVDFTGQDLSGRNFRYADLRGANFNRADLTGIDLRDAKLGGADFNKAKLVDADLRGAELGNANFTKANLTRADLRGADLGETDLGKATTVDAKLDRPNDNAARGAGPPDEVGVRMAAAQQPDDDEIGRPEQEDDD